MTKPIDADSFDDGAAALAARQAEIVGPPQRIAPLPADDPGEDVHALVRQMHDSIGNDSPAVLEGYFLTMARHPDILRCQLEMATVLFKGRIQPRERELAILRVGWLARAPYEWGEHVRIGLRLGLTDVQIAAVAEGPQAPGWTVHEAAILAAVDELLADQFIADATWQVLAAHWDAAQLIEFVVMVGQYLGTAFVQNSLRMRLSASNPGLVRPG